MQTYSARRNAELLANQLCPILRARRTRNSAAQSPEKREMPTRSHIYNHPPAPNPLVPLSVAGRYSEKDDEFILTTGDGGKKRAFSIFHDAPEMSPGRTESPLEERRYANIMMLKDSLLTFVDLIFR